MFEEQHRIVAAQGAAQQPDRILGVGRHRDLPARIVDELHLVGLAVPRVAALEEAARHAQHHRRGEAVVRAPAHRPAIVDLLGRRLGIFAELDFGHRHQAGQRHADRATDDAFLVELKCRIRGRGRTFPAVQASPHGRRPWARHPRRTPAPADWPRSSWSSVAADRRDHVDPLAVGLGVSLDAGAVEAAVRPRRRPADARRRR